MRFKPTKKAGIVAFTLAEILIAVAVIAVLSAGAMVMIAGSVRAAKEQKLSKDVATLNAALSTFLASGGDLENATTADAVIERIKTRAESDQDALVGVRSGLLDPRITPVDQSTTEAATTVARVYWDPSRERFVIKHNGGVGIKEFILDESKADALEAEYKRKLVVKYAKDGEKKWVWEYAEHSVSSAKGPDAVGVAGGPDLGSPSGPSALKLKAPEVSFPGDLYPLSDFDQLEVTLTDPNPAGLAEIYYSLVPGVWERYVDPIPIDPGANLQTQASAVDGEGWSASDITRDEYRTNPLKLEIALSTGASSYNYVSLGGALEPGNYPAPTLAAPPQVTLENGASLPDQYVSSGVFNLHWTLDGSDPSVPGEGAVGDSFSGTFSPQSIWLSVDDWGAGDQLNLEVYAQSYDTNIVLDSDRMTETLTVTRLPMRAPLIALDPDSEMVSLALQTSQGDMPLGSRIIYTTDGTDPGIGPDGEPLTGTVYVAPFSAPPGGSQVIARAYPPVLYQQWFDSSNVATLNIASPTGTSPPAVLVTMSATLGP